MVTMAKKAKKVRSEVVVTPELVSARAEQESEEEKEVKPKKNKNKKKNKTSAEASEISEIQPDSVSLVESTNHQTSSKPAAITKSSKENMKADYSFISSFLGSIHIPQHKKMEDGLLDATKEDGETLEEKQKRVKPGSTSRASTREELRDRLQAKLEEMRANINVNDKKKERKLKKKLARIEKSKKDSNELKQKLITLGKNAGSKGNLLKASEAVGALPKTKGVKTEKGVVFSKFDFKDDLAPQEVKKTIDPKAALSKVKKEKEMIKMWEEKGRNILNLSN